MLPVIGRIPMSSLFGQPAPSKWVRLNSSIVRSRSRYPDGEPVGVSGLNCTMPNGTTAPGYVLPPAPPGTGLGELLSSVPMNGLTYWVRLSVAAAAGVDCPMRTVPVRAAITRPARGRLIPGVWDMMASPVLVVGESGRWVRLTPGGSRSVTYRVPIRMGKL